MSNDNLISMQDYLCTPNICCDCYEHILDSIEMADALIVVGGKQFIDFPKYDAYISEFLGDLKDKAENNGSPSSAYSYVSVAAGFFDLRHEFINHLGVAFSHDGESHTGELKRMFDIAFEGYRSLADHVANAHELLFRANQLALQDEDIQNSKEDEPSDG